MDQQLGPGVELKGGGSALPTAPGSPKLLFVTFHPVPGAMATQHRATGTCHRAQPCQGLHPGMAGCTGTGDSLRKDSLKKNQDSLRLNSYQWHS